MTSRDTLVGKVALVTGGAKRVGRAVALALAEAGCDVAITYRTSGDEAADTIKAIESMGRQALAIDVDLAEPNAVDGVRQAFDKAFDRLHILVNNASAFEPTPPEVPPEVPPSAAACGLAHQLDRMMAINARAPLLLMQTFAPLLAADARIDEPTSLGRIVNFVDIHVLGQPLKGYMAYNMSKAALLEATMTAAMELAPLITVNAIAPGVVAWAESYDEPMKRDYMRRVPLSRPGTPDDAAAAVLFLARDAHYCTGQVIRLDGGRLWT